MISNDLHALVGELNDGGVVVAEHGLGCLEVRGKDGLDLLQRLSTNDVLSGPVPRAVRTVFTSEKGRALTDAEVVVTTANVHLIVERTALGQLREWVERFTVLEDISLTEVNNDLVVIWFLGPYSFSSSSLVTQLEGYGAEPQWPNAQGTAWWRSDLGGIPGVRWLAPGNVAGGFLEAAGHGGSRKIDAASYELIRIAAGVPRHPNEFDGETHPLELGLRDAISFKKGCYVGQEVVARLDAYGKGQRQLVVLAVQGYPEPGGLPAEIIFGDQVLGRVTSISSPLSDGSSLALAICRKGTHTVPGAELLVRTGAQTSAARVRRFLGPDTFQPEQL